MRKLKIDEKELKEAIEFLINDDILGISMNELRRQLSDYGFDVSPQIVRRNIVKLIKERKIRLKRGKLEHA